MLSNAAPEKTSEQGFASTIVRPDFFTRKIWLPRLLYDCLPYLYLTAGFAAFFATLYINQWFWVLPHYVLFSAGCMHLGIMIYGKRHAAADSEKDVESGINSQND